MHLHAPDAAALPGGVRRAEDQADAAFGEGAARDRHRARRAGLPLRDADPAEGAREAGAVLQRPAGGGGRGAGPALDLRGAARLSCRGARPGGARRLRDLAGAAAEPREVGGRRRPHPQRRGRGAGRGGRQVHPARGRLQVDRRGADPRRHRQPGEGAGGVDRQRALRARGRGGGARGLPRHPGARRLRRARHRGQDPGGAFRARAPGALPRDLPRDADGGGRGVAEPARADRRRVGGVRPRGGRAALHPRDLSPEGVARGQPDDQARGQRRQGRHDAARRLRRDPRATAARRPGSTRRW